MFGKQTQSNKAVWCVLVTAFTLGLIAGIAVMINMPTQIMEESGKTLLSEDAQTGLCDNFIEGFAMELLWMVLLWLGGYTSAATVLSALIIGVRGFLIGFSAEFIVNSGNDALKVIAKHILPQCITALPLMTVFAASCIGYSKQRYGNGKINYVVFGGIWVVVTMAAAFCEACVMLIVN